MSSAERDRLLELLTKLAYEKRRVVLSSGRESDFYIDCKRTALTARGHFLVGRLVYERLARFPERPKAVGGLTLGADPLASAVSLTSYLSGEEIHAFLVRKEPKGHGTGQWIEGLTALKNGDPVVVLEDVVTTGASTLKAVERARSEGLRVLGVVALVDRQEGGREAVEAQGVRLEALFTRADFIPGGST